ncbi:MAG: hypothetical protein ABIM30_08275 [candidate division WOR-3 bacterium]
MNTRITATMLFANGLFGFILIQNSAILSGVFKGKLFSDNEILVIEVKGNATGQIRGSLFTDFGRKIAFSGTATADGFRAQITYKDKKWDLSAKQNGNQLAVILTGGTLRQESNLLKLTDDVSPKTVNKIIFDAFHDPALIGKWNYAFEVSRDGVKYVSNEIVYQNNSEIFYSTGKRETIMPAVERLIKSINTEHKKPPLDDWYTWNGELKTVINSPHPPSQAKVPFPVSGRISEFIIPYSIKNDTLIFFNPNGSRVYYLRSGTKKQKETE